MPPSRGGDYRSTQPPRGTVSARKRGGERKQSSRRRIRPPSPKQQRQRWQQVLPTRRKGVVSSGARRKNSTHRWPSRSSTLATRYQAQVAMACVFRTCSQLSGLALGAKNSGLALNPSGEELSTIQTPARRNSGSSSCNPTSLPRVKNAARSE